MKKPIKLNSGDQCKQNLFHRKVKRISSGKGKLLSEMIKEMRR
jgi:hypothetical protein